MKKFALLFLFLFLGLSAGAQETYLFARRDTCDLYLDIFRPALDAELSFGGKDKPTIVYVFGGGFVMGQRVDDFVLNWFHRLNDNGYQVVTIDYRLGMKGHKMGKGLIGAYKAGEQFYRAQQMGVEDLFSAIRFLSDNREELAVDPDNLVLAGSSAGAIISQAAEYDILCGRTGELPEGFQFKGVMAFAGAVIGAHGKPSYPSAPCPTLMLHGMDDKAVAYDKFSAFGRGLWGSSWLASHWKKKGFSNYCIYRFKGHTHSVAAYMDYVWEIEREFLEQNVIQGRERNVDAVIDDPTLPEWYENVTLNSIYR